ncbi:MAG: sigma 54-interacting transcriptional regulator [Myxococcales bacterium]|nr:sigma 54-interacting transcriptional regulator [Myxococcales bacterium]
MGGHTVEGTAVGSGEGSQGAASADLLTLAFEGQRPLAGGARMSLAGVREVHLGRGAAFEARRTGDVLAISLPDDRVSGSHARLLRGSGAASDWTLADDGSRNGTFVGDARHIQGPLAHDQPFSLGSCLFFLSRGALSTHETTLGATLAGRSQGLASLVPPVAEDLGRLAKIAASELPVLLLGESGTGKEVLARATHALSARARGPFVAVNSGALTQSLLEAQLFGHVKGAFSGAVRDEPGYFRAASGGSLFLDEIGELALGSQAVLLRALETREVVPVGSTRPVSVDVRVIAATLRPVESLREDLHMRLAGYTHRLAPLRERMGDLGLLIAELLPRVAPAYASRVRFTPEATRALGAHEWRLNVRELAGARERARPRGRRRRRAPLRPPRGPRRRARPRDFRAHRRPRGEAPERGETEEPAGAAPARARRRARARAPGAARRAPRQPQRGRPPNEHHAGAGAPVDREVRGRSRGLPPGPRGTRLT